MFHDVFLVVHDVLQCLVSRATIGIGDHAAADRLRDRDNTAGIGDNSAEIVDDAATILKMFRIAHLFQTVFFL